MGYLGTPLCELRAEPCGDKAGVFHSSPGLIFSTRTGIWHVQVLSISSVSRLPFHKLNHIVVANTKFNLDITDICCNLDFGHSWHIPEINS